MAAGAHRRRRGAIGRGRVSYARRITAIVASSALIGAGLASFDAGPAGASSVPGVPGTPVAVGMHEAAALRWDAPADVGSPPLTHYRVEVNDGSGWSTAT